MVSFPFPTEISMKLIARFRESHPAAHRLVSAFAAVAMALSLSSCQLIGMALNTAVALLPLKLYFYCIPEGTQIDIPGGSAAIESLKPGDKVIGYDGETVTVKQIHGYDEDEEADRFLEISFDNGKKVDLCDMHRIGGVRAMNLKVGDKVSSGQTVTAVRNYKGVERSYDLLTEDAGYQIGGVAVNSMIEEMYEAGQTGKIKQ